MLPGTLASWAAGIGLAGVGFDDPDLVLPLTVPLGVLCLLMIALHTIGIVRAWRGTSAVLKVPAYLTFGLLALLVLLYLWTEFVQGDAELEPSMVVIPVFPALAGTALLLLRTKAATAWLPTRGQRVRLPRARWDVDLRPLVDMAVLMTCAFAVYLLANILRPRLDVMEPAVSLFDTRVPTPMRVAFWGVLASWAVVPFILLVAAALRRHLGPHVVRLTVVAVLLSPFLAVSVTVLAGNLPVVLVCLPSTAFALWAVHRTQRYRRLPVRLLLGGAAWGAFASGFSAMLNVLLTHSVTAFLLQRDQNVPRVTMEAYAALGINAGVVEELSKGVGVAAAYFLARRHLDGVVAGVVLGAAVGLGFNLHESVDYMALTDPANPEYQYWMRQSVGLLGAHTAFTAVVGGGFGVARQLRDPRRRRLVIAGGFVVAIVGHIASNLMMLLYSQVKGLFAPSDTLDILVLQPLLLVVLQGPLVAVSVFLVRRGLRREAAGLATALHEEAATGLGAVSPAEIPVLLSPARRRWVRVMVLRRHGIAAFRRLRRVQAAQLDLAAQRWHGTDGSGGDLQALRDGILRLKDAARQARTSPPSRIRTPA